MPLDPSIVSNAFANISSNMPDVNALMRQRVRGAENIYQIETARQEQAAEAEKEAAKAQEDAAIKALLPAYTYGIQTGDMAGALKLVPPEMQGSLAPYVDALTGKSPQEVQAALIGSLSSSPTGQEALAAIQRGQTAQIQMGQLDVSRGNLALERQKAALAARGEGEWKLQEAEGGFFWTNPRSRQVIPADVTGGAVPGQAPDVAAPGQPAPEAPEVAPPAFKPKSKKSETTTESERIAAYNSGRALNAAKRIAAAVKENPDATAPGAGEAFVNLFVDPNLIRSEERQRVSAAQREMIDALLTLATGAAYNREQLEGQMESYVPRWTDEEGTRDDKRAALLELIESAKVKAGRAWTPEMDAAFSSLAAETAPGTDDTVDESNPLLSGKK